MTDNEPTITTSSAHGLEEGDEIEFTSASFWSAFSFTFDWRDIWVGIRWGRLRLCIQPVPMFGLSIDFWRIRSWKLGRSGPYRVAKVTTTTIDLE